MRLNPAHMLGPSFRGYRVSMLPRDLAAGVTVAALTVPSALAYAQLAGLPAVYGLYASLVPLVIFALFVSGRQQVAGPDATLSVVIGSVILTVAGAGADEDRVVAVAGMLALVVGVVFLVMSAARLGFLANFLSGPLLVGFLSGMAVEIFVSQLPKMLGFPGSSGSTLAQAWDVITHLSAADGWSIGLSAATVVIMLVVPRFWRRFPTALVVILLGLLVSTVFDLADKQVDVLGTVPSGLPPIAVPFTTVSDLGAMIPGAIAIVLIGFADQSLEGRAWARRGHYQLDANRDLAALGLANAAGSFAGGYPVGSSGSRTSAGIAAGGRSQVMSLAAAAVIALVLVFLAPYLTALPQPVLGAVVAVAAIGLFDVRGLAALRNHPVELVIAVVTLVAVVVLGVLPGVAIALILSLLDVIRRVSAPGDAVLGRRANREGYFDVDRSVAVGAEEGTTVAGLLIYRFDAPLFFANAEQFRSRVISLVASTSPPVRWVIVDASAVIDIDATASGVLDDLFGQLADQGVTVAFANANGRLRDRIHAHSQSGLVAEGLVFKTLDEAVDAFHESNAIEEASRAEASDT